MQKATGGTSLSIVRLMMVWYGIDATKEKAGGGTGKSSIAGCTTPHQGERKESKAACPPPCPTAVAPPCRVCLPPATLRNIFRHSQVKCHRYKQWQALTELDTGIFNGYSYKQVGLFSCTS